MICKIAKQALVPMIFGCNWRGRPKMPLFWRMYAMRSYTSTAAKILKKKTKESKDFLILPQIKPLRQ